MSGTIDGAEARTVFDRALADHDQSFGTFFLARLLDLEIRYEGEACIVAMPVRGFLHNPQGSLHGGVIATVLDISMGHLIHHASGRGAATLEMKVSYLRPVARGSVEARGSFAKRGRSVSFLQSEMRDEAGRLVATATASWFHGSEPTAAG